MEGEIKKEVQDTKPQNLEEKQIEVPATSTYDDDDDFDFIPNAPMTKEESDELLQYFETHPLFMKELPQNIQDNPELSALQNLLHDDTPQNLAQHFNKKGNQLYKNGGNKVYFLREAIKCYTEGIQQNCSDANLNSRLHNNRALLHIKFKNFGRAIKDCKKAIEFNPNFTKAYYRCAQSLYTVFRNEEALQLLKQARELDPKDSEIEALFTEVNRKIEKEKEKQEQKKEQVKRNDSELFKKCIEKGLYIGKNHAQLSETVQKSIYLDDSKQIIFPIMVYYLEFMSSDYIEKANEDDILLDHVEEVLVEGLPWDQEGHYRKIDDIEIYLDLNCTQSFFQIKSFQQWPSAQGYKKIDFTQSVLEVFKTPGYIIPMIPEIILISKASQNFYESFHQQYDIIQK